MRPGPSSARAPGMLAVHYAPRTPLHVVSGKVLAETAYRLSAQGKRAAVLAYHHAPIANARIAWFEAPSQEAGYARELYTNLRRLDQSGCDVILVEQVPEEWDAVRDRLSKAAVSKEVF